MANYSDGRYVDRIAGAAFDPATQAFKIVKLQADSGNPTGRSVILASAATDQLEGVLNLAQKVASGDTVSICGRNAQGTFKVLLNGTVSIGDALTSDSTGAAITTTTSGNQIIGFAQEAGVAGQVIEYRPCDNKY